MTPSLSRIAKLCLSAALLVLVFLLIALQGHLPGAAVLGILALSGASWILARQFSQLPKYPPFEVQGQPLALFATAAGICIFGISMFAAARGILRGWPAGLAVLASYLLTIISLGQLQKSSHEFRNPGLWLMAIVGAIEWPALGLGSLVDPWETHYSEVAREMISRDDWISTWWSWQGWFFSKPVLTFWLQALSFSVFGARWQPDQVLQGYNGTIARPEWIVRAPMALLSIATVYLTWKVISEIRGRRAGWLSAIVLATSSLWVLLSHQAMTDMQFVAPMTMCLLLCVIAWREDPSTALVESELVFGNLRVRSSVRQIVMFAGLVIVLPQILYLITRNIDLVWPQGFRWHPDEFMSGSPGNCNLPGNPSCGLWTKPSGLQPIVQAGIWLIFLATWLLLLGKEQYRKGVLWHGAWLMCALAVMAKGAGGFAIPAFAVLATTLVSRQWKQLLAVRPVGGLLLCAVMVLPWWVAMYVRHGDAFTNELLFQHMMARAFSHIHDVNLSEETSIRYYLCQLGYGLFPWTGWAIWGLAWAGSRARRNPEIGLLAFASLGAFALFSLMGTRFHYYIFPALPPAAILVGLLLDSLSRRSHQSSSTTSCTVVAALVAIITAAVAIDLVAGDPASVDAGPVRLIRIFTYRYDRPWPGFDWRLVMGTIGVAFVSFSALATLRKRPWVRHVLVLIAVVWASWTLDVYLVRLSPHWGQGSVISRYYTKRTDASEPLVAYQLNWKGENFYTGNHVAEFMPGPEAIPQWLADKQTRGVHRAFVVTEWRHLQGLESLLRGRQLTTLTNQSDSNQFVLTQVEL